MADKRFFKIHIPKNPKSSLTNKDELNWMSHGEILERKGKYEEAINSYEKVTELNPDNVKAWYQLGFISLHRLNWYKKAVYYFDKALEINPYNEDALQNNGASLKKLGRRKEAMAFYKEAATISPVENLIFHGAMSFGEAEYEEAIEYFNEGLKKYPADKSYLSMNA